VLSQLAGRPELVVADEPDGFPPDVAVVVCERLDDLALAVVRRVRPARALVVTGAPEGDRLLHAVEAGACGLLRREDATSERLGEAVLATAAGSATVPADLLGRLLEQVGSPPAAPRTGRLTDRELDVLRLLADGCSTREVARLLAYSERTIKNIVHDLTTRLQLRNRTQAVAVAVREGLVP
jgi:DNA-binding NarL/FixJ family response regulator